MKKTFALLLICVLLFTSGCGAPAPRGDRAEFDAFCARVNGERASNLTWTEEERAALDAWTPDSFGEPDPLTPEEEKVLATPREGTERISGAEAREDVETYFKALKAAYGGYEYFGGDEVFEAAKEEVLAGLYSGSYSASKLEYALNRVLSPVIRDGHFLCGQKKPFEQYREFMYYVPDLYFDDLTGLEMDYVKPTIGPDGALTYCFAVLRGKGGDLPKRAVVAGMETELEWVKSEAYEYNEKNPTAYRRTAKSGVTVLESRTMMAEEGGKSQRELEEFAAAGEEYRGLPVMIVDIRGNGGGSSTYSGDWLEGLTGREPQPKAVGGTFGSSLFFACVKENELYASVRGFMEEEFGDFRDKWKIQRYDGALALNGGLIFVLTDRFTASAAEDFTANLRATENTVFVGSNTYGNIGFGNVLDIRLPHSGLHCQFGASISFFEALENTEGVGFPPDLWVNPPDALDAVIRMIDYYGLR